MYPLTGCARLNLREVAKSAGVNLGMFHYYFKTKDEFLRRVLQDFYEEFFSDLNLETENDLNSFEKLRSVMIAAGLFARDNRNFMGALVKDLMSGEKIVIEFGKINLFRHVSVILKLIGDSQRDGYIEKMSPYQVMAFTMSGINFPSIVAGFVGGIPSLPKELKAKHQKQILSDTAVIQRVDMALKGISKKRRSK